MYLGQNKNIDEEEERSVKAQKHPKELMINVFQ